MPHRKLWEKMIGEGEEIRFEFTIGRKYRNMKLIVFATLTSLVPISAALYGGLGHILFFVSAVLWFGIFCALFFYYVHYLRIANAYALTTKRIIVHRGWLNTHTTSIEYSKITDISIVQSFAERLLSSSGSVRINTAGTATHEVVLHHIENPYEVKKKLGEVL